MPDNVEIRKVADESDVNALYQFAEWRWHVPDEYKNHYAAIAAGFCLGKHVSRAHMWQAWHGGRLVAKAGMYQGSGSVGICWVAAMPEARGLGLARALTLTALHGAALPALPNFGCSPRRKSVSEEDEQFARIQRIIPARNAPGFYLSNLSVGSLDMKEP